MALSEISLREIDSSIDIAELHRKFDDDWYNMYKPLTLENTLPSRTIEDGMRESLVYFGQACSEENSQEQEKINTLNNVFVDSTGIEDGDTIAESMTKKNNSICWIDLDNDPSVFTTNDGDSLLYNNE